MAVTHLAPGKIKAILYFKNKMGHILILPTDEETLRFKDHMRILGYEMMAAESLREAESLQNEMQLQMQQEQSAELYQEEANRAARREAIRQRLTSRLNSAATSAFEKDFIRMYLVTRQTNHENFKKRFTSQIGHLDALGYDNPNAHIASLLDRL